MMQEDKKKYGTVLMVSGSALNLVGFVIYSTLAPTDFLSPDFISQLRAAFGVMMVFSIIGGIMGIIGFVLLLDWYKSTKDVSEN